MKMADTGAGAIAGNDGLGLRWAAVSPPPFLPGGQDTDERRSEKRRKSGIADSTIT